MDVLRRLIIAFTIRETSPRYWLVLIAALLAFVVPAVILSTNDVSVPAAPRIAYSLLIVTLAGIRAAPGDPSVRLSIATSVAPLAAIFGRTWNGETWQAALLLAAAFAAFGAGLFIGSRNHAAYLSEEFGAD